MRTDANIRTSLRIASIVAILGMALLARADAPKPTSKPATKPAAGKPAAAKLAAAKIVAPAPDAPKADAAKSDSAPILNAEQAKFFEAKIRPVLSANCYKCHSIEKGKTKANLVLDSREGWQKGGDTGPAIIPGEPAKSLLIKAVSYLDADLQMPPKGEKLSDAEIADLTDWVKMGAPDPRSAGAGGIKLTGMNDKARAHWAYQPVKDQPVPAVKDKAWVRTPVDYFILAKLEQNGMTPSRPAAKEALLRRATYDLIGLPPTPQELAAFVRDDSDKAFEKVVDRLLKSPHYGERWGRFWLDTARYSDTTGFEQEAASMDYRYAYAWTYRDWVIKSFNEDRPYDQFLLNQLAADQLPADPKDPDRLAALGFLTVGKRFQNVNDTIDERIDTISKATMGLTMACARCHDHKFDPIPTTDYYSLHGVLSSTVEPQEKPVIGKAPSSSDAADYQHKYAGLAQRNTDAYYEIVEQKSAEFRGKTSAYLMANIHNRRKTAADIDAKRKLIADAALDTQLLNFLNPMRKESEAIFLPLKWFEALGPVEIDADAAKGVLDKIAKNADAKHPLNPLVVKAFKDVKPASVKDISDAVAVYARLFKGIDEKAKAYIKANATATGTAKTVKPGVKVDGFEPELAELIEFPIAIEPAPLMTPQHVREVAPRLGLGNNPFAKFYYGALNELELTHPGAPARAMVVADAPTPKDSAVFIKGDPSRKGPVAVREFLEIIAGPNRKPFSTGSGRLEFAKAVATKDNPLTARVLVNRVWMHHFGEGFVRTPDDLGVQSEPPTHPELLDYLASEFVKSGWSIKKLHKQIMLSRVYQQNSDTVTAYAQKDPGNRLLWRANVRRLDFEAIRDSMLMFTGKLDRAVGGRPVNLTDEPYSNRRTIYGYIDRNNVPELVQQFDFGDPNRANSHRTSTIVPQQALFFMNSPMSADVARKVVTRQEFLSARDDYARVRALYEELFQRQPRGAEMQMAVMFFNAHDPKKVAALNAAAVNAKIANASGSSGRGSDPKPADTMMTPGGDRKAIKNEGESVERRPLTLWEQYAQALLFTNEIVYVN